MQQVIAAVAVAVIAGLFGWGGTKFARRKEKADAASIITATAMSLLAPLNVSISELSGRVSTLESEKERLAARIRDLERDNRNLRSENTGLRGRVSTLEKQLLDLGHTPANGTAATVTTQTTETVKTITQET
jgi:chromosome segregation ATPase